MERINILTLKEFEIHSFYLLPYGTLLYANWYKELALTLKDVMISRYGEH